MMGQLRGVRSVGQGRLLTTTAIAALLCLAGPALAGPVGGTVVDGAAAISQAGTATNIHQSTNKAIINWQGFSVGANESVNFYQPGASSVTLNRVIGNETSVINGALNANGQVFIVNSAGVLFGKGSQVNVGGLVASTHDISNKDFMAENYTFSGTSNAAVINQGRIRAHGGGYVALLGKTVSNEGVISARLGTVAMSAGEKLTLNFEGNSLLDVTIDKGALNALVENKRAIIADGGRVILTAKAADQVLAAQVNNTGIVQARTIASLKGGSAATGRKGRRTAPKANPVPDAIPADVPMAQGNIKIYAYGGTANIAGKLDASALKGGDGGFIETSGDHVKIVDSAQITTLAANGKTGTWLIDPVNFTIAASGGDITGAKLSELLATTSQSFSATNNLYVNDAIMWSANTSLSLTAGNNLYVNKAITLDGDSAALNLTATVGTIYINNAVSIAGASATLTMTYGTDYSILTPASYAGTVLDASGKAVAQIDPHALANGGDGIYGSITFSNFANKNGLTINGQNYTLIHSVSDLDLLDKGNSESGMYYNPATGAYDTLISSPKAGAQQNYVFYQTTINGSVYYYNSATGAYDIPRTIDVGGVTKYYNLDTKAYDLGAVYSGKINRYDYDFTTGKYVPEYDAATDKYFDISTGRYQLDVRYAPTSNYFDVATGAYKPAYDTASGKYYDPQTGNYTSNSQVTAQAYYYFNPTSGRYELSSAYVTTGRYALARDLSASGTTYVNSLIESFGGTLAGLGHTISDLTINNPLSSSNTGLLGTAGAGSLIRDIGLTDVDITGTASGLVGIGALIGRGAATVHHAYSTGKVTGGGTVGGLIGGSIGTSSAPLTVSDSFSTAIVTGTTSGGLIGRAEYTTVYRSYAGGNVSSPSSTAGGLIGYSASTSVYNSYATGDVKGGTTAGWEIYATDIGGLIGNAANGFIDQIVKDSFATGKVSGATRVGGLIGGITGISTTTYTIENSYATGDVVSILTTSNITTGTVGIGGLLGGGNAGSGTISILKSFATGDVAFTGSVGNYAGGLVGQLDGKASIDSSFATGDVTGSTSGSGAAGLLGAGSGAGTNVSNSYATGNVTGNRTVAGLVGANSGVITNSWASGNVIGKYNVGGLVGTNTGLGSIIGSHASGAVTGIGTASDSFTGALVGTNAGLIRDSYTTGSVTGPNGLTGGIAGANFGAGRIVNSYYSFDANGSWGTVGTTPVANQTPGIVTDSGGLGGEKVKDIAYYANGTINQVLADRAFRAEGTQTGSTAATGSDVSSSGAITPATAAVMSAMHKVAKLEAMGDDLKQVEQNIKTEDKEHDRDRQRRKAVVAGANRGGNGGNGGGYGATIRSIDVDGQRFNLEGRGSGNSGSNNTSAPGGAQ